MVNCGPVMPEECCENCQYFRAIVNDQYGTVFENGGSCRVHAPVFRNESREGEFPQVDSSWWCGEWRVKP
jgi:hypothetical protein